MSATEIPVTQICIALVLLAAGTFLLLRHIGLALVVIVLPLLGAMVAGFAASWLHLSGFVPGTALALAPGYLIACILAWHIASRIAAGEPRNALARAAATDIALPLAGALMLVLGVHALDRNASSLGVAAAGAVLSLLAAPLAMSRLPFGEDFVARFNRVAERRRRRLLWLDPIVQSRWAWSIAGISVVLTALGYFGIHHWPHVALVWLVPAMLAIVVGLAAIRDWRFAIAAAFSLFPLTVLSLWAAGSIPPFQPLGLGALAIHAVAARAAAFVRQGDDVGTASLRVIEQLGAPIIYALLVCAVVLQVFATQQAAGDFFVLVLAGVAALTLPIAFAVVIEGLFPRHATIEARHRVG